MIVYHGSVEIIQKPDIEHSFRPLDFGKGFYVTTVKKQAEKWARRKATLQGDDVPIVNIYNMASDYDGLLKKRNKSL